MTTKAKKKPRQKKSVFQVRIEPAFLREFKAAADEDGQSIPGRVRSLMRRDMEQRKSQMETVRQEVCHAQG